MLLQLNSNNQSLHKIVAITLFDVGVSINYQILAIEVSYQLGPNFCHTLLKRHVKFIQEQGLVYFAFIFTYFSFWQFFFLAYYAQDFARSFNILLKVKLYRLLNSDTIHIIYLNCIDTSWTAIARLIMSQFYTCMLLVNAQTRCADCSIRVYRSFSI